MFERIAEFKQYWAIPRPVPQQCRPVKYKWNRNRHGYVAIGARCTEGRWAKWNERTNRWELHDFSFDDWDSDSTITRN